MYCKHCGKPIDNDSIFCSHCGKKQMEEHAQSMCPTLHSVEMEPSAKESSDTCDNSNKQEYHKRLLFICAGIIISALIVWGCFFLLGGKTIADISIDKVTKDLSEATNRYERLYGFHEGLARVKKDKKFGFIDKLGEEIIPCKYDVADDFKCGVSIVKIAEKDGLIDRLGNTVVACKYDNISSFDTKDSTASVYMNDLAGRINSKGEIVISLEYEECGNFSEGLAPVRKNGLFGFIDQNNSLVIPCIYEDLYNGIGFSEGLVAVKHEGVWGYIDKTGEVVIPFNKSLTGMPFSSGLSTICRGGLTFTINGNGLPVSHETPFEMAFIDRKGKLASEWHTGNYNEFRNGYATFNDARRAEGMIDRQGNVVIPCEFSLIAHGFSDDGLFWVTQGGERDGFYNIHTSRLTIPCEYDITAYSFSEGLVAAKRTGKCGFLNSNNEIVIPFIYDSASNFSEGFAVVERFGKYGYVDRYGNDTFSY